MRPDPHGVLEGGLRLCSHGNCDAHGALAGLHRGVVTGPLFEGYYGVLEGYSNGCSLSSIDSVQSGSEHLEVSCVKQKVIASKHPTWYSMGTHTVLDGYSHGYSDTCGPTVFARGQFVEARVLKEYSRVLTWHWTGTQRVLGHLRPDRVRERPWRVGWGPFVEERRQIGFPGSAEGHCR